MVQTYKALAANVPEQQWTNVPREVVMAEDHEAALKEKENEFLIEKIMVTEHFHDCLREKDRQIAALEQVIENWKREHNRLIEIDRD